MKKTRIPFLAASLVFLPASITLAQNLVADAPANGGATIIYRQVMPDGRVVYSDKATKGVKIDRILAIPATPNRPALASGPREREPASGSSMNAKGSGISGR
jgi:hypothetical protein